jgi:hypothetical protein
MAARAVLGAFQLTQHPGHPPSQKSLDVGPRGRRRCRSESSGYARHAQRRTDTPVSTSEWFPITASTPQRSLPASATWSATRLTHPTDRSYTPTTRLPQFPRDPLNQQRCRRSIDPQACWRWSRAARPKLDAGFSGHSGAPASRICSVRGTFPWGMAAITPFSKVGYAKCPVGAASPPRAATARPYLTTWPGTGLEIFTSPGPSKLRRRTTTTHCANREGSAG